jgi:hypothetical protein
LADESIGLSECFLVIRARERRGEGERGDWARGDKLVERWLKLRIVMMFKGSNACGVQRFKGSIVLLFKGSIVQLFKG